MTVLFSFFFLTACSLSQEQFQTESIDITCTRLMECHPEDAAEFFDFEAQEDCVSALLERLEPTIDCIYDPEKARDCLNEKYDSDCESFSFDDPSEACDEALICDEEEEEPDNEDDE